VVLDTPSPADALGHYHRSWALIAATRVLAGLAGVALGRVRARYTGEETVEAGDGASRLSLPVELAPQGIRVVGLRPQGMPEIGRIKEALGLYATASGMTWEEFRELVASRTHTHRLSTLADMANVAVFMASDQASGMTERPST
jgi:hypothetical protein